MINYREVLRLDSLGINHAQIAMGVGCTRQTVITVLKKAKEKGIQYSDIRELSDKDVATAIRDGGMKKLQFKMPDYELVPHGAIAAPHQCGYAFSNLPEKFHLNGFFKN